jgi:hypothetical protein
VLTVIETTVHQPTAQPAIIKPDETDTANTGTPVTR